MEPLTKPQSLKPPSDSATPELLELTSGIIPNGK
jgi:hypothetical protein